MSHLWLAYAPRQYFTQAISSHHWSCEECRSHKLLQLQATHIFDGLEQWPTHLMYLSRGRLQLFKEAHEIPELAKDQLLELVEG